MPRDFPRLMVDVSDFRCFPAAAGFEPMKSKRHTPEGIATESETAERRRTLLRRTATSDSFRWPRILEPSNKTMTRRSVS